MKLGMQVVGAKVAVSGSHLDRRMAEDSAQVIKIASILDEPTCECVTQVVPSEVSQAGPLACSDKAVLHIYEAAAIGLCEQIRGTRPLRLSQEGLDGGDCPIAERYAAGNAVLGVIDSDLASGEIDTRESKAEKFLLSKSPSGDFMRDYIAF
jgi:hypothetical protein